MITKVLLKNWRSHEDSELNFTTGTNALLGILGSGKSSVLDAICFCLFGTFPNLQARKIKIEDILMKKPMEKNRAEVEVYFLEGGKTYSVKRIVERGKGTTYSEVRENGRIVESPNTSRVNELVEKILKVSYDLFSKAIYSDQNAMDYFLTIPRGQRMRKIDELLGIDRFEKARANAGSLVNKLLEKREGKMSLIEGANIEDAEKTIAMLKESVAAMKKDMYQLDVKMREIAGQRDKVDREIGETRKVRETLEGLKRDERGVSSLFDDTFASLQKLEGGMKNLDTHSVERELRDITRTLSDMESIFKDEQRKYTKLHEQAMKSKIEAESMQQNKIEVLEKSLEEKKAAKEILKEKKIKPGEIEEDVEKKKKLVEKFEAEMELVRMKINDLKETIETLNEAESKCPTCDSKMTEEKKILLVKKKQFEIEKLKEKYAKSAKEKDITAAQLADLQETAGKLEEMLNAVKDLDKIQTELNNTRNIYEILREQSATFEKELQEARAGVDGMEKRITESRSKRETLEMETMRARDYEEKKNKIETLIMQRKQLMSSIKTLEDSLSGRENSQLETLWKNLVTEEKTIAGKINGLGEIIGEREMRLRETETKISGALKWAEEIRKLDVLINDLRVFQNALEATQSQLRREFVTSVNYTMNELWTNLYPYQDFSRVQLSVEDGDYVMQLEEKSGKWVNVEGFASGGERSIAALTLRMAFALVLAPQLKWLVLDEPTANMDSKAVEDLAVTLSEHIGDFIEQTFLITHDEKLENAVTGYAYKFERDKANDGFTKIVQI